VRLGYLTGVSFRTKVMIQDMGTTIVTPIKVIQTSTIRIWGMVITTKVNKIM